MRPKLLKITAFGPYSEEQVIDFTLLDQANMFLIHGPTGGGKTTILDAMCYALYGETNGGERSGESMRSKFATPQTVTEIEFIFSLRNKEYKIIRRPQYEREAKRGSGRVKVNSEVEFYKKEQEAFTIISSKYNEVSDQVSELLHFSVGQFRQVIMIAQNKFRELLTVSSKERQTILQDIFETGIYQDVEKKLEHMQAHFKESIKEKQLTYDFLMNDIDHQDKGNLKDYITTKVLGNAPHVGEALEIINKEKKDRLSEVNQELETIATMLVAYQKKIGEVTQKYNQAQERDQLKIELDALIEKAEEYKVIGEKIITAEKVALILPIDQNLEEIKCHLETALREIQLGEVQLQDTRAKLADTKKQIEASKEVPSKVEALKKEYSLLESYRPKMESLTQHFLQKEQLSRKLQDTETKLSHNLRDLEQMKREVVQAEAYLKKREEVQISLATSLLEQKDFQFILDRKELIDKKEKEKEKLLKNYQFLKKEADEKEHLVKEGAAVYAQLFEAFMLNQAGELAQTLKLGFPCPVCGSLEHPRQAVLMTTRVTKEILSEKEKENKKLEKDLATKKEELATVIEQGKGLRQMIEGYEVEIKGKEHITPEIKQVLDNKISLLENQLKALEKIREDYDKQKEAVRQLEEVKETLGKFAEEQKLQLNEVETKIKEVQKDIPKALDSNEALCDKLEELKVHYSKLEEQYQELTLAMEQLNQLLVKSEATLEEKNKAYRQLQQQKEEKEKLFQQALVKSGLEIKENYEEGKRLVDKKEQLKAAYESYTQKRILLTTQLKDLQNKTQDFKKEDLEIIQKEHESFMGKNGILFVEQQELIQFIKKHDRLRQEIMALYEESNELIKEQAVIEKISLLAKGKNKKGLSFERYIQSSIFEEVLKSANKKLKPMTQGRYELYRTDDMLRANAQAGLDMGIIDHYNDETRSVSTLSGGESFMAALALALGLADVIQRLAGATPLEAMFIDEGFGSLDEEALELAIKTLLNIQDTGRLIGIISHVKELKEQIPIRLEITAGTKGSKAVFCV